jgi:hypothetical protein
MFIASTPGIGRGIWPAPAPPHRRRPHGQAGTRIDLLTVIMHELGHQIGLSDIYAPEQDELMFGTIRAGERRCLARDDLHYAKDARSQAHSPLPR